MPAATANVERRLVLVVGAIVFVDTMFYAAIEPLLPGLVHDLHMSKFSAGVMTAAYPAGTLLGSLPAGVLAARLGPRTTVYTGLTLLALSTLAFGFLQNEVALDLARLIEGVGGACSWSGGLAWIVAESPANRRGAMIGSALGAAIAGSLFGPLIGTLATAIGRGPAFCVVVVAALGLIEAARRLPSTHAGTEQGLRDLLASLRSPTVIAAMWLVTLPAIASGTINVLGPLRLHRFGASAAAIGAAFLVAAGVEATLSPWIGRVSDRHGRFLPLRFGLAAATGLLACFTLPTSVVGLGGLIVVTAAALGAFWAPAMAMLTDAADRRGLDQGLAAALTNIAWAGGQILGGVTGGALAKVAGDGLPFAIVAGGCAGTLLLLAVAPPRDAAVAHGGAVAGNAAVPAPASAYREKAPGRAPIG